jgi:hypothetical protein
MMRTRRRWLLTFALVAVMALLLAACPEDDAIVEDDNDVPEPTAEVDLAQSCENEQWGYTVDYPGDWVTNEDEDDVLPPCSAFDPDAVEIDLAGERPIDATIVFNRSAQSYEHRIAERADQDEMSREEATVDGHEATVIQYEATGRSATFPQGTQVYAYYINLEGATLIVTTAVVNGDETAFDEAQDVLDAMMASIDIYEVDLTEPDEDVDEADEADDNGDDEDEDETDDDNGDDA